MLWFRAGWLCLPAYCSDACTFQNSSWRSCVGASSFPTVSCGNDVWSPQVTHAWAWCATGIRIFCYPPPYSVTHSVTRRLSRLSRLTPEPLPWAPCPLASGWFGPWGALAGNEREREDSEVRLLSSLAPSPRCHIRITMSFNGRSLSSKMSL